jgi:hypothetical protein
MQGAVEALAQLRGLEVSVVVERLPQLGLMDCPTLGVGVAVPIIVNREEDLESSLSGGGMYVGRNL